MVKTTDEHPFWVPAQEQWVDAADLHANDVLETLDKTDMIVSAVVTYRGSATMYKLAVAGIHTYYVMAGRTPVLVHNDGGLTPEQQRSLRSLQTRSAEHQAKLDAYRADPDAFDNDGRLKNAPTPEIRQRIIDGRIKHLQKEIVGFNKQADNLKRLGGMC